MAGLREAKKSRTRAHLSEVATALFLQRGFEAVTVAEVAAAAGVSTMTVFNYFPRKEDLFLDLAPQAVALITTAVRQRPGGTSPLQALRALALDLAEQRHALSALGAGALPFLETLRASPALLARAREIAGELEAVLAAVLDEDGDPATGDRPELWAALILAAYRSVCATTCRHRLTGHDASATAAEHVRALHAAFDALQAATTSGSPPPPPS